MYKPGGTIKAALEQIDKNRYVLPAIQREFVWSPDQICRLFDSLMQGYPFGTFLLWNVEPENNEKFKFYGFVQHYHQRDNPHCPELTLLPSHQLMAVLDGQQRLTALRVGLRGSLAIKLPNKWWTNPDAFPICHLYLNLLATLGEDEEGNAYEFKFLDKSRSKNRSESQLWFRVGNILTMERGPDMNDWVFQKNVSKEEHKKAFRTLDRLHQVIHTAPTIFYYEESAQDIEKVLQIFIRMNSGGTVLSYSDLLLSIAVAQWSNLDARQEINSLVDELNGIGSRFNLSKDFVLKAGLMLTDIASVGFKVENFNRENMQKLEDNWESVREALLLTVRLAASFGLNGQNMRADSGLLPIAYYLAISDASENFLTHSKYNEQRKSIWHWLSRSYLKASGIWGSGLDTLLTELRKIVKENGTDQFPVDELKTAMAQRGKSLSFDPEEIEELENMQFGDMRAFLLLSILYPHVDLKYHFHIDHVFPISRFTPTRLRKAGVSEGDIGKYREKSNSLANLQLLEGPINNEKRQKLPADWLTKVFPNEEQRSAYIRLHDLGNVPEDITGFDDFFEARLARLRGKIRTTINTK